MGMFDFFKKKAKAKTPKRDSVDNLVDNIKANAEKVTKATTVPTKTEKQIATEAGEPWVQVLRIDVDPNNLHQGAFELDWNDIFVARLVKAGYMMKPEDTDSDIVDRWFQNVCRHVVMETWEQEQAIRQSGIYVQSRDIGGGRSEIS
jgi:hypothetical protein